jgi:hypothetical protein
LWLLYRNTAIETSDAFQQDSWMDHCIIEQEFHPKEKWAASNSRPLVNKKQESL